MFGLAPRLASLPQVLNIQSHFHASLITLGRIFRDGPRNYVVESRRQFSVENGRRYWITMDYLEGDGHGAVALKWPIAGQECIQNHPEREQVRATVNRFIIELLWRHVCRST